MRRLIESGESVCHGITRHTPLATYHASYGLIEQAFGQLRDTLLTDLIA